MSLVWLALEGCEGLPPSGRREISKERGFLIRGFY